MAITLGSELSPAVQQECRARFVHRFTGEHRPRWANEPMPNGTPYRVQFKDDADWLAHTKFNTKADGTLDERYSYCVSDPTWPEGNPLLV